MAGYLRKEVKMENIKIKEEIQEEILPSSTVEDTCSVEDPCNVFAKEEDVKFELTDSQG